MGTYLTKVPGGCLEVDREPQFKVGDKVRFNDWDAYRGGHAVKGTVTVMGIYDTKQAGGIPDEELHLYGLEPQPPKLVYAYSVNVERDGGIWTYKGVPEFILTLTRKR